ncbi:Membrane-associated lipoprotein precursor [Mycoplasmopsis pulmonis]|nr:Membrane-associated lipoprotein precursor [Mycoplasmopsis pulmonis]
MKKISNKFWFFLVWIICGALVVGLIFWISWTLLGKTDNLGHIDTSSYQVVNYNKNSNSFASTRINSSPEREEDETARRAYQLFSPKTAATYVAPNKIYQDNFKTSLSLSIPVVGAIDQDGKPAKASGTTWILDYQLTEDGSYPLTWYFATNAHVATYFSSRDFPESTKYFRGETEEVYLRRWDLKKTGTNIQKIENDDKPENTLTVPRKNVKLVFMGNDYLTTKPNDYFRDLASYEEIIDFAVFEIKFQNEAEARKFTSDYALWEEKDKNNFIKDSLLKDYLQTTNNYYYISGYPDPTERNEDGIRKENQIRALVPSINKPVEDTVEGLDAKIYEKGAMLSEFENNSMFGKKGIVDSSAFFKGTTLNIWGQKYYYSGLLYYFRNTALSGGSSGSKTVDKNNKIVGIHALGSDLSGLTGSVAFKSEGFKVQGLPSFWYRNYFIPQYDLIYGGGKEQKKSYKDSLKNIKKIDSNFKTHLFPKGFNNQSL